MRRKVKPGFRAQLSEMRTQFAELGRALREVGRAYKAATAQPARTGRRDLDEDERPARRRRIKATGVVVSLETVDAFKFKIVAEHFHRETLAEIGPSALDQAAVRLPALLTPEPGNPHDPWAVAVVIGERRVGYLSAEDAEEYHEAMEEEGALGGTGACQAEVGAVQGRGGALEYRVRLNVDWPPMSVD